MELNKEILQILNDHRTICEEQNWDEEQNETRAIYDAFRIQNIFNKKIDSILDWLTDYDGGDCIGESDIREAKNELNQLKQ